MFFVTVPSNKAGIDEIERLGLLIISENTKIN